MLETTDSLLADVNTALGLVALRLDNLSSALLQINTKGVQAGGGDASSSSSSSPSSSSSSSGPSPLGDFLEQAGSAFKDFSGGLVGSLFGDEDGRGIFSPKPEKKGEGQQDAEDAAAETDKAVAKNKADSDNERIKSDSRVWETMVANALSGSKKLRKIHQALATGAVVIDIAAGVVRAFAQHGFPGGIIPAAKIAATGAQKLATIKGQAHDGIDKIPSTGTYLLEAGERVVDKRLNRDLSAYLANRGASTGSTTVNNSPSVSLTINGDASPDAVKSNRSALERMIRDVFADHALPSPFDA